MSYYTQSVAEVLARLETNKKDGLSAQEASARLEKFGLNKLPEKKSRSFFSIILAQFKDLFTIILLVAAFISLFVGEGLDSVIILIAVLINIVISIFQERKAVKTIANLKEIIVFTAKVERDGNVKEVNADELVPGDIVYFDVGDRIPADARLLSTTSFEVKESVLTGESVSVSKKADSVLDDEAPLGERENMVFQGTVVMNGRAKGVVVATGTKTEVGQVAELVENTEEESTPLQKRLQQLSVWISVIVGVLVVVFMLVGVLNGNDLVEMFQFAIALAISSIPEGMVLTVTVILAVGMRQILNRKAIVRELLAAETLGSTTVICTDKTGTITTGEMEAERIITPLDDHSVAVDELRKEEVVEGSRYYNALLVAALNNDLIIEKDENGEVAKVLGDTTEQALLSMASDLGFTKDKMSEHYPLVDEIPFDSYIKYMVTLHDDVEHGKRILLVKGTVERVMWLSGNYFSNSGVEKLTDELKKKISDTNDEYSLKGYRVISLGYAEVDSSFELDGEALPPLTFLSLVALRDPIREHISDSIALCEAAGISVKMITGDHKLTAKNIANDIGLQITADSEVMEGKELEVLTEAELEQRIGDVKVFARVAPVHKLKIVEMLQRQGEVVAMTGDGVNDGPALKRADIGVAMGSGTQVARQTSDMVLLDDNFGTIVAGVEEGRRMFDNIRKVILYLLSDSFSEIIMIFGALVMGLPVPILPVQILWINIVDDGFTGMSLAFDPAEEEIMEEKPRKKNEPVVNREMQVLIGIIGLVTGIGNLVIFYFAFKVYGYSLDHARSLIFALLAIDSLLYIFSVRSMRHSIFHEKLFSNKYLLWAVVAGVCAQLAAIYFPPLQKITHSVPLTLIDWGVVIVASLLTIAAIEIVKWIFLVRQRRQ